MIKLIDLLKENKDISYYPNIKNKINIDKPKINPNMIMKYRGGNNINISAYDFGGSEHPVEGNKVIVIDIVNHEPDIYIEGENFIKADLTQKHNFPPKNMVIANDSLSNFINPNNINNVIYNIDNSINNGGLLFIHDWPSNLEFILEYLPNNFKMLEIYLDLEYEVVDVLFRKN
jgi:hypothetical protein